jgi:hypothetical protein
MKALIATALVALSLLSTAAHAGGPYDGYPDWARIAFESAQS